MLLDWELATLVIGRAERRHPGDGNLRERAVWRPFQPEPRRPGVTQTERCRVIDAIAVSVPEFVDDRRRENARVAEVVIVLMSQSRRQRIRRRVGEDAGKIQVVAVVKVTNVDLVALGEVVINLGGEVVARQEFLVVGAEVIRARRVGRSLVRQRIELQNFQRYRVEATSENLVSCELRADGAPAFDAVGGRIEDHSGAPLHAIARGVGDEIGRGKRAAAIADGARRVGA
jgi:hypothetical protein